MLTIVNGSVDKVKTELKQQKKWRSDEEKNLKKKIKNWVTAEKKAAKEEKRKENQPPKEYQQKLMELEGLQKMYSQIVPIRVGDIFVDYKTYQKAVQKLSDFDTDLKVENKELVINYGRGNVHLYDVSSYFKDFQHIPLAVIADGQEA